MTEKENKYKTLRLAFGKVTKLGGWSHDLSLEDFEFLQTLTVEQIVGARIGHRTIQSTNKKTGEKFESIVYEIILPEKVAELKAKTKKPLSEDDL